MKAVHIAAAALLVAASVGLSGSVSAQTPARNATGGAAAKPAPAAPAPAAPAPAVSAGAAASATAEREPVRKGGEVIARVGGSDVTADELRAVIVSLNQRQQATLRRDPALLSQTVRSLLANRLVLKEALGKKWEQKPSIAAQLERARENVIVETYLQSLTTPPADFPGEQEIKSTYEANASALMVPRQFQLAQIFVALSKDADKAAEDKARKKLDEVLKKLKQPGADFVSIVRSESDDADSVDAGGEIGWLTEAQLRPEIRTQVTGLAKAAATDPIKLDDGWHILKLIDTKPAQTRPLAEVRDALVQRIRDERIEANRRAYLAELLKQSPPAINELALSKLLEGLPDAAR